MPNHMVAWHEVIDQAALGRIAVVQDDILTPSGPDRFLVPGDNKFVQWGFATGGNITGARLVTPSLEVAKSDLDLIPFQDGDSNLNKIALSMWIPKRFIELEESENMEIQASEDGGGATALQAFLSLGPTVNPPMPEGNVRSIRLTGTQTLTANEWTSVTLTPESTLEAGRYTMVHFSVHGVSPIAGRWLPQGGGSRPGMFAFSGASPAHFHFVTEPWDRLGWFSMLDFTHITLPQIQIFATAADTAQVVQMYAVRTGDL